MAEDNTHPESETEAPPAEQLESGAYEVIRSRLLAHGQDLRDRLASLNAARKSTFGSIEAQLVATERVTTANNCIPRDLVTIGERVLFGFNVQLGLRSEMRLADVFAVYLFQGRAFKELPLDPIQDARFVEDFQNLYRYYKHTRFAKFAAIGPHLYMVFQVSSVPTDVKTFKWLIGEDGTLTYLDNRSDHEYRFPAQHEFEWTRATRDMHRFGLHPHVSIRDRIFVETVGGDLTIKIEDNTATGEGIYTEPVDDPDQTLDDAAIYYACVGNLILLKIQPYSEKAFRYIVYSEKVQQACRIDAIENSCVLLPEDHGLIFANGYYLQTGEYKQFGLAFTDMLFEKSIASQNGEDYLYAFYNRESGTYILLSYNMIAQRVDTPTVCHGYSLADNGEMIFFRSQGEPQKYHTNQIWPTPYVGPNYVPSTQKDSYLYRVGNRDIVRCMAGCQGILNLIGREDSYANLYLDIVKHTTDILDAYFWLEREETGNLRQPLTAIREAAAAAIEEFEKVVRLRRIAREQLAAVQEETRKLSAAIRTSRFETIDEYVQALSQLRSLRGQIISRREVRYVDLAAVGELEAAVDAQTADLAQRCVEFLLAPDALKPYAERIEATAGGIADLGKVTDAKEVAAAVDRCGQELDMLIEIVSNLKIDDATQRTAIIDNISAIYARVNQIRAALKNRIQELAAVEGVAEFGSQLKLLNQSVINFLDICDTPAKCEEYLGKLMIQLEEMEGRFADFDDFVEQLARKREEIYNAFESRKLALVEANNKRADGLLRSAERILKGIRTRAAALESVSDINGYFAADLMIDKVRDLIRSLTDLGDPVKADDIQSRLKTIQQDAVRQLKDRQDLFVAGTNVIRLGNHRFSVNTQALDLTVVPRGGEMYLHLTGTNFFEAITDEGFLRTREAWAQEVVSEDRSVYRAEYLAFLLFRELLRPGANPDADAVRRMDADARTRFVQAYMGPRYNEAYIKGVHDQDAGRILAVLLEMHAEAGLLRYHPSARALAAVFWQQYADEERKRLIQAKLRGLGALGRLYPAQTPQARTLAELRGLLQVFVDATGLFDPTLLDEAAAYLFHVLAAEEGEPISAEAGRLFGIFQEELRRRGAEREFTQALREVRAEPAAAFALLRDWTRAALADEDADALLYLDEVATLLYRDSFERKRVASVSLLRTVDGLAGSHPRLEKGLCRIGCNEFMLRLAGFADRTVPRFEAFQAAKSRIVERARAEMRLEEFRPRVLTSFVRNRLLDRVYLPLVGDNLAKQVGVVGENKRTDLMGLLLLISPPGYGKTTLMEYVANRLGLIFMKINGPAIGHRVTSLDPAEAPNASAREELEKLNLALEMGDNIMLYVDDIQHCHPEFLQKFISLCDAQRKIEGVYKGRTRTYDLRGRKVCVVMAGNPYTESGELFKIPDMLANRADTYNLGDIIGDNGEDFRLSYLENALTSNPVLAPLASRSQQDVYGLIRIAQSGSTDGVDLEGNYTREEMAEFVSVLKKLLRVRDVVLAVNQEYIRSAGQADEFRTEPAFKLQGSYRNMNRIAEKVLPVMNDDEIEALMQTHYENEAQTLTTGTESNLLKFKELGGRLGPAEAARWEEIQRTFRRNQVFRGPGSDDRTGQVLAQLASLGDGLGAIRDALREGASRLQESGPEAAANGRPAQLVLDDDTLDRMGGLFEKLAASLPAAREARPTALEAKLDTETLAAIERLLARLPAPPGGGEGAVAAGPGGVPRIEIVNKVPQGMLFVLRQQYKMLETLFDPLLKRATDQSERFEEMQKRLEGLFLSYENLIQQIDKGNRLRRQSRKKE